jgi:hypothetical protein
MEQLRKAGIHLRKGSERLCIRANHDEHHPSPTPLTYQTEKGLDVCLSTERGGVREARYALSIQPIYRFGFHPVLLPSRIGKAKIQAAPFRKTGFGIHVGPSFPFRKEVISPGLEEETGGEMAVHGDPDGGSGGICRGLNRHHPVGQFRRRTLGKQLNRNPGNQQFREPTGVGKIGGNRGSFQIHHDPESVFPPEEESDPEGGGDGENVLQDLRV